MKTTNFILSLLSVFVTLVAVDADAGASVSGDDDVMRDICIIGGGSSGTYAAIRLKEMGHSVALIEKKALLGGHVDTFRDPVTGKVFDYGVIAYVSEICNVN